MLSKCGDPLLVYRSTPLGNGYSPAQMFTTSNLRTTLYLSPENRGDLESFQLQQKDEDLKMRQKKNFDSSLHETLL